MEENHRPDEGPSRRASALADASATRRIAIRRPRRAPFFASATFEATTGRSKKRSRMRKKSSRVTEKARNHSCDGSKRH
jgi:hypothetical protein